MLESLIPDYAYWWVYFIFATILVIGISMTSQGLISYNNGRVSYRNAILVGIIFIVFFGLRPTHGIYMADTWAYADGYNAIKAGCNLDLGFDTLDESLWNLLLKVMADAQLDVSLWFTAIAGIYICFNLIGIHRVFRGQEYAAFLFYIVFFLFYSAGTNGIRNACGYSIVFYAMTISLSKKHDKYFRMAVWCFIGYLFHSSVIMLIASIICANTVVKSTKKAVLIWFVAIFLSLVFGNMLANYISQFSSDPRAQGYLDAGQEYELMPSSALVNSRFRWDFLLFSALPIYIGYYVTTVRGITDKFYQFLLNTYILTNAIWVVFIYAAFSNRFAMLSWCIYPYVLYYPFAKFKIWGGGLQNQRATMLLWLMLLFNLWFL